MYWVPVFQGIFLGHVGEEAAYIGPQVSLVAVGGVVYQGEGWDGG